MRPKINSRLRRLIVNAKKKNPYLGVRALSRFLSDKHKINLSKSSIQNVFSSRGIKERKGRKESITLYKKAEIQDCSPLLLRSFDSALGLLDHTGSLLKASLPFFEENLLRRIIALLVFRSAGLSLKDNIRARGFSRAAGIERLPLGKVNEFLAALKRVPSVLDLGKFRETRQEAWGIKFSFAGGGVSFCDAAMTTLWQGTCPIGDLRVPLGKAKETIAEMLSLKAFVLGYTKSFGSISPAALNFLNGLTRGIEKIEFLGRDGAILEEISFPVPLKTSFLIGYNPRFLSKGAVYLSKPEKFKKIPFPVPGETFFYGYVLTRFAEGKGSRGIIVNNLPAARRKKSPPAWGFMTDRKNPMTLLAKYLHFWPFMERKFWDDHETFEKFFQGVKTRDTADCLSSPEKISLSKEEDFIKIKDVLAEAFRLKMAGETVPEMAGYLNAGRDFYKIIIKNIPRPLREVFNKKGYCLEKRRVFIV